MDFIAEINRTDPHLAAQLFQLLNEIEIASAENREYRTAAR